VCLELAIVGRPDALTCCNSGRHVSAFVPVCIDECSQSNIQAAHVGLLVHESLFGPLLWLVGRWDRSLTYLVLNKDVDNARRGKAGIYSAHFHVYL
jgi:hypothetical protein